MYTPELSWIGDIVQDCSNFLLLLATFELHCKGFVFFFQFNCSNFLILTTLAEINKQTTCIFIKQTVSLIFIQFCTGVILFI